MQDSQGHFATGRPGVVGGKTRSLSDRWTEGRAARLPRRLLTPIGFLAPFFVPFILFYVAPVAYAVFQSTQAIERVGGVFGEQRARFGGLDQYSQAIQDPEFLPGLFRVVLFGLFQVPAMVVIALLLALLLDSPYAHGSRLFRAVFFAPVAVPGVIAAIMWGTLLHPDTSPFFQAGLHLDPLSKNLVLASMANVGVWTYAGSNVILVLAALTAVPREVFEAALVDGASHLRIALLIKAPLVRPAIIFATILNIIGSLQLFTEPMVFRTFTSSVTSGYTPNMLAYNLGSANQYNAAAAMSVILAILTFLASLGLLHYLQKRLAGS